MLNLEQIISAARVIAKEYPISRIELFGSYAEGRNTPESDVDLLVEFKTDAVVTLLTLCKIKNKMEDLLNTPVDVIHSPIPENAMIEIGKVVPLYAA